MVFKILPGLYMSARTVADALEDQKVLDAPEALEAHTRLLRLLRPTIRRRSTPSGGSTGAGRGSRHRDP